MPSKATGIPTIERDDGLNVEMRLDFVTDQWPRLFQRRARVINVPSNIRHIPPRRNSICELNAFAEISSGYAKKDPVLRATAVSLRYFCPMLGRVRRRDFNDFLTTSRTGI